MERTEYISGLRELADLLEKHEELTLPFDGASASPIGVFTYSKKAIQDWARAFPAKLDKQFSDDNAFNMGLRLNGLLGGLHIKIYGNREDVCERVVTGTREVVFAAEPARKARPERTEIVEDVEWVCGSLLGDEESDK